MTATSAFVTSLLTSFGIFCGLVFAFSILSKWKVNHNIYYSARITAGEGPTAAARTRNPFAWLREAIFTSDEELIRIAGLDSAIYLNFFVCSEFLKHATSFKFSFFYSNNWNPAAVFWKFSKDWGLGLTLVLSGELMRTKRNRWNDNTPRFRS